MRAYDYPLYRTQCAAMQSMQRRVKKAPLYTQGVLSADKVVGFIDKMHAQYHVLLNDQERHVLRKVGHPAAILIVHPSPENAASFLWVLFSSETLAGENLEDARVNKTRLTWRHYTLTENLQRRWTWKLRRGYRELMEKKIIYYCRNHKTKDLNLTLSGLSKMPMFNGVREDIRDLVSTGRHEWGGSRNAAQKHFFQRNPNWPRSYPIMKPTVFYDDPPTTLGQYLRQLERGEIKK